MRGGGYRVLNKQNIIKSKDCIYPGEASQIQDDEETILQKEYVKSSIDKLYFDHIISKE